LVPLWYHLNADATNYTNTPAAEFTNSAVNHVDEIEMDPPINNILKADAVAKSGNNTRVGTSNWRVGDSKVWGGSAQQSAVEQ
jgi:hypothetical protein